MKQQKVKIALAPMAGITDSVFRLLNKWGGANYTYSEMAHVKAISYGNEKTFEMIKASAGESPYIVQIFGKDPEYFGKAAKILTQKGVPTVNYSPFTSKQTRFLGDLCQLTTGNSMESFTYFQKQFSKWNKGKRINKNIIPDGLNINLGCPAKKVFGHGGGAALCKNIPLVKKIVESVLKNTNLPVSIKVRTEVNGVKISKVLDSFKKLPLHHVMVHGRTLKQGFSGKVDAEEIRKIRERYPQWEIWANGGVVDEKSGKDLIKKTGCNTIGIARGSYGNPLLANQIKEKEKTSSEHLFFIHLYLAYIHSVLLYQSKKKRGMFEIRKHLSWYIKDFPNAKSWREKLVRVTSVEEIENIFKELINVQVK